jgi:hypothetical protein
LKVSGRIAGASLRRGTGRSVVLDLSIEMDVDEMAWDGARGAMPMASLRGMRGAVSIGEP